MSAAARLRSSGEEAAKALPQSPPAAGEMAEVAAGVFWLRFPLPTRLDHVNIYVLEDTDGWTVFDAGIGDDRSRAIWEQVLTGPMARLAVKRLVISHFHIDHVGLAGWLQRRTGASFAMSQTEYLLARVYDSDGSPENLACQVEYLRSCGVAAERAEQLVGGRPSYLGLRTQVPKSFERLSAGDRLDIGGRAWRVLTGGGHAVEQVMLVCDADRLFLAADQVLPDISPNISVGAMQPKANPLAPFLASLRQLREAVSEDTLVLPGHRMPFHGLHERAQALEAHHRARCELILQACAVAPLTALELIPVVFGWKPGDDVIGSALGEAVAHANYLEREGGLASDVSEDGVRRYRSR